MHPHAMHHRSIALLDEALGDLPGFLGDLAEGQAGRDDADVVLHLIVGHAVERPLLAARPPRPAAEGAREVGIVAEAADGVRVQGDELAGPHAPPTRLVAPGLRALSRGPAA